MKVAIKSITITVLTTIVCCSSASRAADAAKNMPEVHKMRRITEHWSANIDDSFRSRVEQGNLVFWGPGRTIWIDVFNTKNRESAEQTLKRIKADANNERKDIIDFQDGSIHRFAYILHEVEDGKKREAVYSFSVAPTEYMMMALYFDKAEDKDWASALAKSVQFHEN